MAALAVLATVGSCQKEPVQPEVEQTPVVELEYQDVTFNVTAPSGPQTKTTYGETVTFETALKVEVYVGEENAYGNEGQWLPEVRKDINKISDTEWEVTISLVKNYHYDIVFWAQKKAPEGEPNPYYTFDWENGKITADYTVAANDVTRDAFYHLCENYNYLTDGAGEASYKIQLKRPFAQINLGASDYLALLELYEFVGKTDSDLATTITTATAEVPSVLNVLDGTADTGAEVKFVPAATTVDGSYDLTAVENNINVNEKSYTLVGSNYIFANTHRPDNPTVEMTLTFEYNNQSFDINVPNVPYARNYQTNILGNFFTSEAKFDVVIVPEFEKEDEYVHVWDGYTTSAPAVVDGEYVITTGAELAWVAEQVNSGENDFAGKKVLIASDIRLADYLWTPIGTDEHPFSGSIEALAVTSLLTKSAAEYYTISGLYVNETEAPAGLVGVLKGGEVINLSLVEPVVNGKEFVGAVVGKIFPDGLVDGVTVTGGQVNGNHFVGGLVGHAYGSVKNSVVDGTVVTGTPVKDNEDLDGDKVGGVIGYHAPDADGTEVSGNKVLAVTVYAKRDAGAVAGAANAANVKENHVEKATIGSTEAPIADNAGIIVGRVLEGLWNPEANTYNHENITVNGVQAEQAVKNAFSVEFPEATIPVEGSEVTVKVTANVPWTVAVPEGVTAEPASGNGNAEVKLTFPENKLTEQVSYKVTVSTEAEMDPAEYKMTYTQEAVALEFAVTAEDSEIPVEGGEFKFDVTSNVAWKVAVPEGVTANQTEGTGNATVYLTFLENTLTEQVSYKVTVSTEAAVETKVVELAYVQAAAKPAGPVVATVAEFLAAEVGDTEYQLTGVIEGTYNTTYGNFYLNDGTDKVLVYGLTATKVEKNDMSFASLGLRDGDTVTLIGTRAVYNEKPQVGGPAYYVSHVAAPFLDLAATTATIDAEATEYMIALESNTAWTAVASEGVNLDKTAGEGSAEVTMTVAANTTNDAVAHTVTFTYGEKTATFTLTQKGVPAPDQPEVVGGGSDDFNTISSTNTSYVSGKTTAGWNYANCAIFKGGTTDSSPTFKMIGDASDRALCMNGKTSAVGKITSPTLNGGCGTLTFNYGLPFKDSAIKFRVDIMQNGNTVHTFTINKTSAAQYNKYTHEEVVDVAGEFQIVFTNLSPSNSTSNKDRTAIWNVVWTGCAK